MRTLLTLLFLLRCRGVSSLSRQQPVSFLMVFSAGTQLMVDEGDEEADYDEDDPLPLRYLTTGPPPSVRILSSVPLSQDPGSPRLLVCILSGLRPPLRGILWWVDGFVVTSPNTQVSWMMSEEGGDYNATSVWEVSAAEWRSRSMYWCGTIQEGRVYRESLCSEG